MHGFPIPLETIAAWDDFPPRLVKIPSEEKNAGTSSGFVSFLTKITFLPESPNSIAFLTSKTTIPLAAPGDAAIPFANCLYSLIFDSSIVLCNNASNCCAGILVSALSLLINFSFTMSTDVLTKAAALIFAVLVCNK